MLSDTRLLRRALAYLQAARVLHSQTPFAISLDDVDAVLAEVNTTPMTSDLACGVKAVYMAGARVGELSALARKARANTRLYREAELFVPQHWAAIVRLANSIIELRNVSIAQIKWLTDQPKKGIAA
jgi:hypothetical protein